MPDLKIPGRGARPATLLVAWLLALWLLPGTGLAEDPDAERFVPRDPGQARILALPAGTSPEALAQLDRVAVGLMSPGLGEVSAQQTWLDVSQGARLFDTSYDTPLETLSLEPGSVPGWGKVMRRARSAQNPVVPGLLASLLARHGLRAVADRAAGDAALAVVRMNGSLAAAPATCDGAGRRCPDPVTVSSVSLPEAAEAAKQRRENQLVVFVEAPPARLGDQLSIAIGGPGMHGTLESPSTRTDGYVLSTDIAPTVLRHFGIDRPARMTGQPIEAGGELDLERLNDLQDRYEQVGKRRGAALVIPLLLWVALATAASLPGRGRYARFALRVLCLATVLLPGTLLATAAMDPSLTLERTIATVLPVLISILLLRLVPGWPALALACGLTVIPYGVDMLAGSALTPRAVIGPNPGLGARFYGIGNELESTLMILTSVGTAAALTWWDPGTRRAVTTFLVVGLVATVIFAAGRFGADVGAAIVFPVAAVVAAAIAGHRPKLAWAGLGAAALALAGVALADVVTGSETHYVRSVFGGSGGSLPEVLGHRLEATVESFTRLSRVPVTVAALVAIAVAVWKRDHLRDWTEETPLIRAGLAGAAAGSIIGALTNDSGALFIQVGALYLALVLGFVWATRNYRAGSG